MGQDQYASRIRQELKDNHLVVFMTGTPAQPRCAFSAAAAEKLKNAGVSYKSVDILSDPSLRDGLRQYTNCMHFPQIFMDGRFVGTTDQLPGILKKV